MAVLDLWVAFIWSALALLLFAAFQSMAVRTTIVALASMPLLGLFFWINHLNPRSPDTLPIALPILVLTATCGILTALVGRRLDMMWSEHGSS